MPSALAPRVRERAALAFLLVPPLAWLIIAYLGSLAVLMVSAFWSTNSFTGAVVHKFTTDNLVRVLTDLQRSAGFAVLLIEHVLRAVRALAQRVLVLHHGELIADGSAEQVMRQPAVVASYLGPSASPATPGTPP